jgi:hypothetical protein
MALYVGSVAQNAVLASIPAPVDVYLAQFTSSVYTPPENLKIQKAYARGGAATAFQFDSPNLRRIGPPEIQPFNTSAEPTDMPPINNYGLAAMDWLKNDPLSIKCSRAGAGAEVCQAALWLSQGYVQPVYGPSYAVRFTASATLTTTTWVQSQLTLAQNLPPGRYRIMGMSVLGATTFAGRLILPGETMRPGVIAQDTAGEYDTELFRRGEFGSWGEFESYAPPVAEFLGLSAGADTPTVWLDLMPLFGLSPR